MQYFPRTDPPVMERVQSLIERQHKQYETYSLGWNGLQYLPETDEVEVGYLLSKQF